MEESKLSSFQRRKLNETMKGIYMVCFTHANVTDDNYLRLHIF